MAAYIPAFLLLVLVLVLLLFVAPGLAWLSPPPITHTRHTGRHLLGAAVLAVVEEEKVATTTQEEEESSESSSPPPWDASFVKARWMMPSIVERALISAPQCVDDDRHDETNIDPLALLDTLDMATADRVAAQEALFTTHPVLANVPAVLSVAQCTQLRRFFDNKIKDDAVVDNVDGCPDHQVNIHVNKLRKLIGAAALERILAIPVTHLGDDNAQTFSRIGVFLRKYQADGRPWMPFHADGNAYTVNIALNSDDEFVGGRLLALYQQGLHVVPRQTGNATCHAGSVYHAVSAMQAGTRYSLICFLHQ